ncbi:hypothetical protein F5884DRAFT_685245 [Xylogone sp. PMI_703]|nr:hypothetical protein F5884DRAFT_685245 [Xylogone sp. PMI_703]
MVTTLPLNASLLVINFTIVFATGHEKIIQVNYISTMLLTVLLLTVLKSKPRGLPPPRLTLANSVTAHLCKFFNRTKRLMLSSFNDTSITPWDPEKRYSVSKLLCQFFIVKLTEIVSPDDVIINMVDPGLIKGTGLSRDANGGTAVAAKIFFTVARRLLNKGATTYINAAVGHGKESHGCFIMNCKLAPLARLFYTDGEVLTDLIWTETLRELSFASVEQIITSKGSLQGACYT